MVASKLVRTAGSALKREIRPGQPRLGAPFTNLSICRRRGDYMPGHPGSVFCGFFWNVHWVLHTYSGSSTTLASVWAEDDVLTVSFRALLTRKRGGLGRFRAVWVLYCPCGRLSARFVALFDFLGDALPGKVASKSFLRSLLRSLS